MSSVQFIEFFPQQLLTRRSRSFSICCDFLRQTTPQALPFDMEYHTNRSNSMHPMHHPMFVWSNFRLTSLPCWWYKNTAPVKSWWLRQITLVIRLANVLTPCSPIFENRLFLQIVSSDFSAFVQFASFRSSFHLCRCNFSSWPALRNEEAH